MSARKDIQHCDPTVGRCSVPQVPDKVKVVCYIDAPDFAVCYAHAERSPTLPCSAQRITQRKL